ncbi:MSMEG_6728 family protein [Nonomuraea sp. K274]|uniref:MSMEG_6728 family protein n=1 Tax=Nonomuraea cypriaca TaxID=1187855 RepID=A0A931A6X9_9ACTN|nr:MSMEG_6728 family protein [Nonomuraea cypriaca]MBF8185799.1 MSMEG_6728 family protein [Nonomuraea cypriaca]
MQTFLPFPDFAATAAVLDPLRLGKQRIESLQVLRALTIPGYGWRHHPVVKMWAGYEEALVRYGLEVCDRWRAMGRPDTCARTMTTELARHRATPKATPKATPEVRRQKELAAAGELPPWLGDEALHRSHRSALLRKDPGFYRPVFGDEPDDLDYVWPRSDRLPVVR